MKSSISIVLFSHLILFATSSLDEIGRRSSIRFDNADITVAVKTPQGIQIAEAFNASEGVTDLQKMRWVSLGVPRLVANKRPELNTNSSIIEENRILNPFEKTADGFFIYVQTLNDEVAEILANEASVRYGVKIQASQFLTIDKHIGKFECESKVYDQSAKRYYDLKGESRLIANQIRVFFNIEENSRQANLIQNLKDPLIIKCLLESHPPKIQKVFLVISETQIKSFGLVEMLFGPSASEVFLTRNQIQLFSSKLDELLNIYEEYDIKGKESEKKFVENLISLLSEKSFEDVDFKKSIQHISTFGMSNKQDLSPHIIEKNLTRIFKVEDNGSISHVALFNEMRSLASSNQISEGYSAFDLFDIAAAVEYYNSRRNSYEFNLKNFSEQLKEISANSLSGVQFYSEGRKILPRSLKVARIVRSRMERNLSFRGTFKYSRDPPLRERISLTSDEFMVASLVQESVYELKTSQSALISETNQRMNEFINNLKELINGVKNELKSSLNSEIWNINQTLTCLQQNEGIECSKLKGYVTLHLFLSTLRISQKLY